MRILAATLCAGLLLATLAAAQPVGDAPTAGAPTGDATATSPPDDDAPAASPREQARQLAKQGLALLQQGQYAEAFEHLRQAERKFHATTHLLYMARAKVALGELVQAHELYMELITEQLPNFAPQAFHDAHRLGRQEVESLRERVPTVRIELVGAPAGAVRVSVDGETVPAAKLSRPIALAPGEHVVEASAADGGSVSRRIALRGGGDTQRLELVWPPALEPAGEVEDSAPFAPIISFGLGGAALLVGVVTGALTLERASQIEDYCGGDVCPPEHEPEVDAAKTLGNVSTAMFVVAGVATIAGVVLLLTLPAEQPSTEAQGATVRARLGAGRLELQAAF